MSVDLIKCRKLIWLNAHLLEDTACSIAWKESLITTRLRNKVKLKRFNLEAAKVTFYNPLLPFQLKGR